MESEITAKQYAIKFGKNLPRIKRWARAFFGTDPSAGMQMGYARTFTMNQAFLLFLGGFLISRGIPVNEVPKLLEDFSPWLEKKGLLPITPNFKPDESVPVKWNSWEIEILRGEPAYVCRAKGSLGKRLISIDGRQAWKEVYIPEDITKVTPDTVDEEGYSWSAVDLLTLNIGSLLHQFIITVTASGDSYNLEAFDKWREKKFKKAPTVELSDTP